MGVRVKHKGNFDKTTRFLNKASKFDPMPILERYGEIGVEELRNATPVDSGLTASSWYYEIEKTKDSYILHWANGNMVDGVNVAILLQYGHATKAGTYVPPNDFITPAIKEVFDRLAIQVWKEVTE